MTIINKFVILIKQLMIFIRNKQEVLSCNNLEVYVLEEYILNEMVFN